MALCMYLKISKLKMVMNHPQSLSCHDARPRTLFTVNREKSDQQIVYVATSSGKNVFPCFCWLYRQLKSHGTGKQSLILCFLDVTFHSSCCNWIPIVDGLQATLCVALIRLPLQAVWYFSAELFLSLHRELMNCGFYILMFCQL